RFYFTKNVIKHVSPVTKHIQNETTTVFLAVIPGRTLGRHRISFKNPIAKIGLNRKNTSKKTLLFKLLQLGKTRQPEFVLYHAMLHPSFFCNLMQFYRIRSS